MVRNQNFRTPAAPSYAGLLEDGGGGVSDVTSNFINSGTLNVLSGSFEFSGGFTMMA